MCNGYYTRVLLPNPTSTHTYFNIYIIYTYKIHHNVRLLKGYHNTTTSYIASPHIANLATFGNEEGSTEEDDNEDSTDEDT